MIVRTVLVTALFALSAARHAESTRWDTMGHYTIAAIAYERLQPATRARVDSLLRRHPDVDALARGLDLGTPDGARELFLRASVWPDQMRQDPRFYNEADSTNVATPLLPGYPDMKRHASWHYLSQSFATDGTAPMALAATNTVTQLAALTRALGDGSAPSAVRAYDLVWIIHIVGDLHQPLHGTSRSSTRLPNGDAGGNAVRVQFGAQRKDTINLHAFWDGALSRPNRGTSAVELARRLAVAMPLAGDSPDGRVPDGVALETMLGNWATESATLARYVAYDIDERADGAAPPVLSPAYIRLAESIARQRVTVAGYRLAALLESRLR